MTAGGGMDYGEGCPNAARNIGTSKNLVNDTRSSEKGTRAKRARVDLENTEAAYLRPRFVVDVACGLLRVEPYDYTYRTFAKGRWLGKPLADVFQREFRDRPAEYYSNAIATGRISINGSPVSPHYVFRNGDVLRHTIHRHEPPVLLDFPKIVFESKHLVVVSKPASIPVHASGRYHHLSLLGILASSSSDYVLLNGDKKLLRTIPNFDYGKLHPIHRLDRLTSGVVLLAKTKDFAQVAMKALESRELHKVYIARVKGLFPPSAQNLRAEVLHTHPSIGDKYISEDSNDCGLAVVSVPLYTESYKLGLNMAYLQSTVGNGDLELQKPGLHNIANATIDRPASASSNSSDHRSKEAITKIERFNEKCIGPTNVGSLTSLVRCQPVTGRTHQIRIHLQFLGYPIANDPIYCCSAVWGSSLGKHGITSTDDKKNIAQKLTNHLFPHDVEANTTRSQVQCSSPSTQPALVKKDDVPGCPECIVNREDPSIESLQIWLHAWEISVPIRLLLRATNVDKEEDLPADVRNMKLTSNVTDNGDVEKFVVFQTPLPPWAFIHESSTNGADSQRDKDVLVRDRLAVDETLLQNEFLNKGGRWYGAHPGALVE